MDAEAPDSITLIKWFIGRRTLLTGDSHTPNITIGNRCYIVTTPQKMKARPLIGRISNSLKGKAANDGNLSIN
jgi:hypothetical protein